MLWHNKLSTLLKRLKIKKKLLQKWPLILKKLQSMMIRIQKQKLNKKLNKLDRLTNLQKKLKNRKKLMKRSKKKLAMKPNRLPLMLKLHRLLQTFMKGRFQEQKKQLKLLPMLKIRWLKLRLTSSKLQLIRQLKDTMLLNKQSFMLLRLLQKELRLQYKKLKRVPKQLLIKYIK